MEQKLKQRLVGATVLVTLAVVFVPMLLDAPGPPGVEPLVADIPPLPAEAELARAEPLAPDMVELPDADQPPDAVSPPAAVPRPGPETASAPPRREAAPEPARAGAAGWAIQLGVFSARENAERLLRELTKAGQRAYLVTGSAAGRTVHKVRVGPAPTQDEAEALRAELERRFGTRGILVRPDGTG